MKKTLLAVAMLFATTGIFAQGNVKTDNATQRDAALINKASMDITGMAKKTMLKSVPDGAELLCDFSDPTAYTFGTTPYHTTGGDYGKWLLKSDTNLFPGGTAAGSLNYFWGFSNAAGQAVNGQFNYWFGPDGADLSYKNGFAYINWLGVRTDGQTNTNFDAYIKINTPISTYGMKGVDIYVSQFGYRFNQEQYFIEWSHDANFSTYDSVEFNSRSIINSNQLFYGVTRINLPTFMKTVDGSADPNALISTDPEELTYIRIRVTSPAGQSTHGYCYMIDDIAYAEAPQTRVELSATHWYNGYHRIPAIVKTPDPLMMQIVIENTGAEDVYDVTLANNMYSGTNADTVNLDFASTGTMDTLSNKMDTVSSYLNGGFDKFILSRSFYMYTRTAAQTTDEGEGVYSIYNTLSYRNADNSINEQVAATSAPTRYNVTSKMEDTENYRWARDCGTTRAARAFTAGTVLQNGNMYITTDAAYDQQGYRVCLAFQASEYDGDVYAKGIELVAAADSTDATEPLVAAGAAIRASLLTQDTTQTTWNAAIVPAQTDGSAVESDVYKVKASDLNTNENADADGYIYEEDLNSIYLPFNNPIKLEEDIPYYACYTLVANGKFAVALDPRYNNIFGTGSAYNCLAMTPGVPSDGGQTGQYAWGYFVTPSLTNYCAPLMRLIVSNNATSDTASGNNALTDVTATAGAMNMYPNPAISNTVLSYTLNHSGNVVINITDLTGRTVMTMDEGEQRAGIEYRTNVDVRNIANGTYFCTITVNGVSSTSKFVVSK
ncbi:MAG: T9SS type A sorting domain-containing protein [Bacteroidales bacterium]|nr:T9SS type A sorting domain-containing protein [Bacteroidales bacterium]